MSSVTRFIRQVPLSTTYYSVPSGMIAAGTGAFELVGSSLGNYADSGVYMGAASAQLVAALATAGAAGNLVLRDMGKTIRCPYGSASGAIAAFRQVQLLAPIAAAGLSLGGQNIPSANSDFLTFYIPAVVAGAAAVAPSLAVPIVGGQM
jgi:hypothetical protein